MTMLKALRVTLLGTLHHMTLHLLQNTINLVSVKLQKSMKLSLCIFINLITDEINSIKKTNNRDLNIKCILII